MWTSGSVLGNSSDRSGHWLRWPCEKIVAAGIQPIAKQFLMAGCVTVQRIIWTVTYYEERTAITFPDACNGELEHKAADYCLVSADGDLFMERMLSIQTDDIFDLDDASGASSLEEWENFREMEES